MSRADTWISRPEEPRRVKRRKMSPKQTPEPAMEYVPPVVATTDPEKDRREKLETFGGCIQQCEKEIPHVLQEMKRCYSYYRDALKFARTIRDMPDLPMSARSAFRRMANVASENATRQVSLCSQIDNLKKTLDRLEHLCSPPAPELPAQVSKEPAWKPPVHMVSPGDTDDHAVYSSE